MFPRRDADAADLRGERVTQVIAIQVERGDDIEIFGRVSTCCRVMWHRVFNHDTPPGLPIGILHQGRRRFLGAEVLLRDVIAPVAKRASVNFMMLPLCTSVTLLR